jgi:iron complex transport system substrate-binding protein
VKNTVRVLGALATLALALSVPSVDSSAATISHEHMCIVSLSPTATETLYALGAGQNVEAVDDDSNYPTTGLPTTRIDAFDPSAEQIASICAVTPTHPTTAPDLVVIAYDANSVAEQLDALGIKVVQQAAPSTLDGAYNQITALGSDTGHAKRAAAIVAGLRRTISADVASVAAHPHKRLTAYYELDPTLYSLTSSTFVGSLLASLGVVNIADAVDSPTDDGYPQLSAEYLVSASPKLVFLADTKCCHVNAANFARRTAFSTISAVVHHHVAGLDDDIASRWGPRIGILMNDLTRGVRSTLADPKVWKKG